MTITHRIQQTIQFVVHGFGLALKHPILFIYPLIFLSIPAIIAISRYFNIPHMHKPEYAYNLIAHFNAQSLLSILLITAFSIALTFVAASVSIHAFALLTHRPITVAKTFKKLTIHAPHLILWGIITTTLVYSGLIILQVLHLQLHEFSWSTRALKVLHFCTDELWEFITFFMLQIHALEECGLLESLKRSFLLASRLITQVIAIKVGYTLTSYFVLRKTLVPLMSMLERTYNLPDDYTNLLVGNIASILLMFFFTIYIVFTTKLYYEHVKELGKIPHHHA